MPTIKQEKAAKLMVEERLSQTGKNRTKGKILKEAGYSNDKANQPSRVLETKGYKEAEKAVSEPIILQMKKERDAALRAMNNKREKASYNDLITAADKLTRNIQLLEGGSTENISVNTNILDEVQALDSSLVE